MPWADLFGPFRTKWEVAFSTSRDVSPIRLWTSSLRRIDHGWYWWSGRWRQCVSRPLADPPEEYDEQVRVVADCEAEDREIPVSLRYCSIEMLSYS